MSAHPNSDQPSREVIAPPHVSLKQEVGRETGPTPLDYGEVRLWVVSKGPCALFAYWEFRPSEHPEAVAADGRARFFLRIVCDTSGKIESTVEIDPACGKCTAAVPQPDAQYHAELGFFNEQGVWCFLAKSGLARTPPSDGAPCPSPHDDPAKFESCLEAPPKEWTAAQEARLNRLLAADVAEKTKPSRDPNRPSE
jgi:hypothetical protein